MDPIGLGFEQYDGAGLFRDDRERQTHRRHRRDQRTATSPGPSPERRASRRSSRRATEVKECISKSWFRYAYGRARDRLRTRARSPPSNDKFTERRLQIQRPDPALTQTDAFLYRKSFPPEVPSEAVSHRPPHLLRGAGGIAIGLPFLEIMSQPGRVSAQAAAMPKRFLVFFSPDGSIHENWVPTGTETNFQLSRILAPLETHKQDIVRASMASTTLRPETASATTT